MEAPLNAREFLKRFHLPQLVRLTGFDDDLEEEEAKISAISSRSLVALAQQDERCKKAQHEKSNWTYRAASRSQQELQAEDSGFRSLLIDSRHDEQYDEHQFRSMRGSTHLPEGEFEREEAEQEKPAKLSDERHKLGIRLTPPSKRINLTKLKLNQPFLLYKAYKKLEFCAYVIDLKNELNEKSGDPIYFPQNYPGWFSISDHRAGRQKQPLESIDDVCRTNAQIFLTRDELIGYQLPSKLSHLTKLKNNQLLALPLAINLDKISQQETGNLSSNKSNKEEQTNSISDIKQVVIGCGQALKICAVYEDVLPLIERKQQQQQQHHHNESKRNLNATDYCYANSMHQYQAAHQSTIYHQITANNPQLYQLRCSNNKDHRGNKKADRSQEKLANQLRFQLEEPQLAANKASMNNSKASVGQMLIYAGQTRGKKLKKQQQPKVSGQRYARCILLSQSSLDRLTNCAGGSELQDQFVEETEVLIPIDQRGRFYLCATNQSIAEELYCRGCNRSMVFRVSQLMSLLSLSRRLSNEAIKLPLMVELVIGPRPSNFSPSMFGSTSDSYFGNETNVGGHSIACRYNRNAAPSNGLQAEACECAQKLMKPKPGSSQTCRLFSAALRIERLAKRDVLLACTIKRDPLVHLDLFNERILSDSKSKSLNQNQNQKNRCADKPAVDQLSCIGQSTRLAALCEDKKANELKSLGKSSFSRLKVCRSLISLNGRRKRRPNIPSSMLSANSLSFDDSALGSATSGNHSNDSLSAINEESFIMLLEFDCNDIELKFVRTFVESSIPTSTIPDLVLNRMEFCQKNSQDWERQLKLSYLTLSRDFDLCKRQMELNRRNRKRLLEQNNSNSIHNEGETTTTTNKTQLFHEKRFSSLMISADNSTASSRSSSGVSSAGERRVDCKTANSSLSGSKLQFCDPNSGSEGVSSGSSSLVANGNSRLLRLVHRILPAPFKQNKVAKDEDVSDRLRRELIVDCGDNVVDIATLMNAQKVHKKLIKLNVNETDENEEKELQQDADSSSHLYESLERLNDTLALGNQRHAHSPGSRSTCAPGKRSETLVIKSKRRQLGKSMDFVVNPGRTVNRLQLAGQWQDESQDEDEWWQSSTRESTSFVSQEEPRRPRATRTRHLDARNMEPVSIEACHFEDASEESLGSSYRSAGHCQSSLAGEEERIYMNLIRCSASLPAGCRDTEEPEERPVRRPIGRMERKLMKLRARRHAYPQLEAGRLELSGELVPPGEWARRARVAYEASNSDSSFSSSTSQVNKLESCSSSSKELEEVLDNSSSSSSLESNRLISEQKRQDWDLSWRQIPFKSGAVGQVTPIAMNPTKRLSLSMENNNNNSKSATIWKLATLDRANNKKR